MSQVTDNNKRIAKNTLLLYVRMLFMMIVSLYTSRVILNALGVEDFGIYNVVGGVVAMFSVISGSLSTAISRFITFELGKGDLCKLNKIFSASVTIQMLLSLIIVVLIESIGVWFFNSKMTIPVDRIVAANWVLQFSIVTFVINLISVPYNAEIIAHEKMSVFAYISILEVIGKLTIAFLIVVSPIDRLVFYAILMCLVAAVIRLTYTCYCRKHFEECTYHFCWDRKLLKSMFGFASWNFIGASAFVLREQGVNVILNVFCGPVVNAARGVSTQVNSAIIGFVNNFMMALNPQITKSYASGNKEYMFALLHQGARLSFYMLLFLSLPILINTEYILLLWLKTVPQFTIIFVQLTLILAMVESISNPLVTALLATGKIKNYQIIVGGLNLLNFPISYIALKIGFSPYSTMYIALTISVLCLLLRLLFLKGMIGLSALSFITKVILNVMCVTIISALVPLLLKISINSINLFAFIGNILTCFISVSITIFYVGCKRQERQVVISFIRNKIKKRG